MRHLVRRRLIPLALGAAILAVPMAQQASAAPEPIKVYGRNAPTYTSYPTDPTPTSKWIASAQGEDVRNTKGEVQLIRGRAAVQETFGIKRVRIYDVALQRNVNGAWKTVVQRTGDVINESKTAYAVGYTPAEHYCPYDTDLKRSYRVVQHHGVRRDDGIVANRTTISKTFTARATLTDPDCPTGAFNTFIFGLPQSPDETLPQGENNITAFLEYVSINNTIPTGVTFSLNFSSGIEVVAVPEGFTPNLNSSDPNDYNHNAGSTMRSGDSKEFEWVINATEPGTQQVEISVTSTEPKVRPEFRVQSFTVAEASTP